MVIKINDRGTSDLGKFVFYWASPDGQIPEVSYSRFKLYPGNKLDSRETARKRRKQRRSATIGLNRNPSEFILLPGAAEWHKYIIHNVRILNK